MANIIEAAGDAEFVDELGMVTFSEFLSILDVFEYSSLCIL